MILIKKIALLIFSVLSIINISYAATITSNGSGNWNVGATWVGGISPVAGDIVFIANSHVVNINNADAFCTTFTVNSGGSLTWTAGNNGKHTLTVSGLTIVNGTITIPNSGGSGVNSTLQCNGNVIINSGGLITNTGVFNMANSTTFTINNGGTYNHNPRVNSTANETMFNRIGATNTFGISSTIIMNGWTSASTSLGQYAVAFGNITFSAGLVWNQTGSFSPNKIKGNVLITNGQINFDEGAGGTTTLTINGTVTTSGTGGVVFAQGTNRNLTLTTGTFSHNGTSGLGSCMYQTYGTLNWTVNGDLNVNKDFTGIQGTGSNVATAIIQVNGNLNISGGLFDFNRGVNAPLTLNINDNIAISSSPGWVRFIDANAGALNVTCSNLNISGGSANNFYSGSTSTGTSNWTILNNIVISGTHTTNFSTGLGSVTVGVTNDINVSSTSGSLPYFMNNGTSTATTSVTIGRDVNVTGAGLLRGAFSSGILNFTVNRNLNMTSSSDFSGQRHTTSTQPTTITVLGDVLVNNATANFNGTLSNGNLNFNVNGSITLTAGTLYGADQGNGNVTVTTTNFTQSAGSSRFIFGGTGSVNFTASGNWFHNGGQHIGISHSINGNFGTVTYSMNNLTHTAGSIIWHSTDITDGRTCAVTINGNASFNIASGSDFCIFNNISSFTTNNAIYTTNIIGNLTVSGGSTAGGYFTRWTNTGPDNLFIGGNMTLSGGMNSFAGGSSAAGASMPNNTLTCTIGGNVSISGAAILYSQSSNNTSRIDLTLGTPSVTWSQTTSGVVQLTNTNIKSGKTVTMTGNSLGIILTGRTATVETGATLWCSNFPVTGLGMFTLSNGAKIGSGSAAGLTSTGATGNIQVSGTRTYNSNATYEYYEGLTPQATGNFITTTTSGMYPTQVTNLIINKTFISNVVNLTNTTDMVNNGTLSLTKGILTTSFTPATAPWIRIPNNSTTVSPEGGSVNSYVNGYIRKTGNGSFIYPTGNGGKWRRIAQTAPSISTEFEARYVAAPYSNTTTMSSTPTIVLSEVSQIEHWFLNKPLGPDAASSLVTLYWEDASASGVLKFDSLAVARWNGSAWENTNCYNSCPANWTTSTPERTYTGSATGTNAGTIRSNTVSNFSPFTLATIGLKTLNPLPVTLTSFDAVCKKNENVKVNWITASEHNTSHFSIERSLDGTSWESIGVVGAAGNSTSDIVYQFEDKQSRGFSLLYYRLVQFDINGDSKAYSVVATGCNEENSKFEIYPNPAGSDVTVVLHGNIEKEGTKILFYDLGGKIVKVIDYMNVPGNIINVNIDNLTRGCYIVKLYQKDENLQNIKLIKQ